jgi:hypothetical protein
VNKKTPQFFRNPLKDRTLVQRRRAADYLLITVLSFGFSVGATRLLLDLTGYPQLGAGNLHIAHVLWGGLFLFIATLLPIIYINEWVVALSGLISGFGVGLFIDEVGKFITQTNDYFFPSAAPIVYVLFLLTVFILTQVRIERHPYTRSIFYEVMERLTEILDHDLSEEEAVDIQKKLKLIIERNDEPDLLQLAKAIQTYFDSDTKHIVQPDPTFIEKITFSVQQFEEKHVSRRQLKTLIIIGLLIWAAWSLISPLGYLAATKDPTQFQTLLDQLINQKLIYNQSGLTWFQARVLLEGSTGILALIAAILLILKQEKAGIWLGIADMLITLTIVNLLIFYFDQFSTILLAAYQFMLFAMLIRFQKRFLKLKIK